MKKAFSLIEAMIALAILVLSVTVLTNIGINYFFLLNSIRQRYVALNLAQEGLELAFALRNKQIENGERTNWLGVTKAGNYCLSFNTSTKSIEVNPASQSNGCEVYKGYYRLVNYQDFQNPSNSDLTNTTTIAVKVISKVQFLNNQIELNSVITKWHPNQ